MALKPSDVLDRLPLASELLEKPPIRALANRWNRSVVASGVRSFLDELRNDWERRSGDWHMPSLRELAERAARHVVALQQAKLRPTINATGTFLGPEFAGSPLADDALDRMVALSGGFMPRAAKNSDATAALCRLTGAEAATVVSSYAGAVWLTMATLSEGQGGREVIIARGEVGDVDTNCTLAAAVKSAGAVLREVGSVNRVTTAEFETAVSPATAAIVRAATDNFRVEGLSKTVELESLVGLARDRELPLVELAGAAPLINGLPEIGDSVPSVSVSLATGVPLIICRGDGLVGGPACGIILGSRALLGHIEAHPMFAAWRSDAANIAALHATLLNYDDRERLVQAVPLFQLLATSVENLRQRAERIAPQLALAADVEMAAPVPTSSHIGLAQIVDDAMPSYGVALTPKDGNLDALDARLRSAASPIISRREVTRLVIDLRTVLPRQDQRVVELVSPSERLNPSEDFAEASVI
jgi:L-seryl-tRNA(Ser) seleniumtransferase